MSLIVSVSMVKARPLAKSKVKAKLDGAAPTKKCRSTKKFDNLTPQYLCVPVVGNSLMTTLKHCSAKDANQLKFGSVQSVWV